MNLQQLKITPKKIETLKLMGIEQVEDLLTHYPYRYEEHQAHAFSLWEKEDKVSFEGVIASYAKVIRFARNQSVTKFQVAFEEEVLEVSIFNRPWVQSFAINKTITLFGKYAGNHKVIASNYNFNPLNQQLGLQPLYNVKDKLTQKDLKNYIKQAMEASNIENFIPLALQQKYILIDKKNAIQQIHNPESKENLKQSIRCLKYEEFFKFQLKMQYYKSQTIAKTKIAKVFENNKMQNFFDELPFALTKDQQKSIETILYDLQKRQIMYRLLQGDVGCGKTLVAIAAMYATFLSIQQSALLAPTELLAKQHYESVALRLSPYGCRVALLYSAMSSKEKKECLHKLKVGEIDVVVGTHALFQEEVVYHTLGLVIADEQHRFGVEQRRKLLEKGNNVDFLLMSATPIPRTLATSLYGDMDVSTIEHLPKGRKVIETKLIKENSMRSILQDVLKKIEEGDQCYIVCPAIELNEEYAMRNVEDVYAQMKKVLDPKYTIAYLHGKMSTMEKDEIMDQFLAKEFSILIATSVIEVGIDIKDANLMVIYDAQRFGLSQLHQLRGRVGRGERQGYCYLLTSSKDPDSLKRLDILCESSDGFEISRQDLLIRGPGDLLGKRQSGIPGFILGNIVMDTTILDLAKQDASEVLQNKHKYPKIEQYILKEDVSSFMD